MTTSCSVALSCSAALCCNAAFSRNAAFSCSKALSFSSCNAFAAFPVMTAAVGLPLLIHGHHGNPAGVAALGMLAGFCGTLLTPMAANFNLVPAALLGLRSRYAVIRAQAPTALLLWVANLLILYWLAFPR